MAKMKPQRQHKLFGHLKFVKKAIKVIEEATVEQLPLPKQVKNVVENKLEEKMGLVDDKHKSLEERLDKIEDTIDRLTKVIGKLM